MRLGYGIVSLFAPFALMACGGSQEGGSSPPPPANQAPVFTSASGVNVAENTATPFYAATASDADGDALTYAIGGGPDGALFVITPAGALSFKSAPDYEAPADAGRDNVYNVTLTVSDGKATTALALAVTVTNVVEQFADLSFKPFWTFQSRHSAILPVPGQPTGVHLLPIAGVTSPRIDWLSTNGAGNDDLFINAPGVAIAPAPDVATTRHYYSLVQSAGTLKLMRYTSGKSDHYAWFLGSENPVLVWQIANTFPNSITAWMGFGPDGFLYILMPDTGDSAGAGSTAQDPSGVFGKILRIDVTRDDYPGDTARNYGIPAGNPFASSGGAPEIWALGVHVPRAVSFDANGNLFFVDSGSRYEEVNLLPSGQARLNYGWPIFDGNAAVGSGALPSPTNPVIQYARGVAGGPIVPGFVYPGPAKEITGFYVFADSTNDHFWGISASSLANGTTLTTDALRKLDEQFSPAGSNAAPYGGVDAIGYDSRGDILVNVRTGNVYLGRAN